MVSLFPAVSSGLHPEPSSPQGPGLVSQASAHQDPGRKLLPVNPSSSPREPRPQPEPSTVGSRSPTSDPQAAGLITSTALLLRPATPSATGSHIPASRNNLKTSLAFLLHLLRAWKPFLLTYPLTFFPMGFINFGKENTCFDIYENLGAPGQLGQGSRGLWILGSRVRVPHSV